MESFRHRVAELVPARSSAILSRAVYDKSSVRHTAQTQDSIRRSPDAAAAALHDDEFQVVVMIQVNAGAGQVADSLSKKLPYMVSAGEPHHVAECTNATCVFTNATVPQCAWSVPALALLNYIPAPNVNPTQSSTSAYPRSVCDNTLTVLSEQPRDSSNRIDSPFSEIDGKVKDLRGSDKGRRRRTSVAMRF